ncbi:MAG: GNAT family N-acetyltransferase [Deltaproteobacteria bacterium]|nr:GNAT family N-acetyltransferase [Deltaproteobacteria bacterium]
MNDLRIETVQHLDVDVCTRLVLGNEPWIRLGYGPEDVAAIVRSVATSNLLLARSARQVVGFALSSSGMLCGEYLKILAVDASNHGRGVGRQLMEELEKRAFATWPNVYLCVTDFNEGARAFYRRLGYEEVGVLSDLLIPGSGEVLMRKSIGAWRPYCRDSKTLRPRRQ